MAGSRSMRLVQAALRCYPQRWRIRHGQEAAELARLLMRDGTPARSIAWSYFKGAASTRLVPQPRGRLGTAVGVLVAAACSVVVSLVLLSSTAPASAISGVTGPCSGSARHGGAAPAGRGAIPGDHYYVAGGTARSSASVSTRVTASKPVDSNTAGGHGQRC